MEIGDKWEVIFLSLEDRQAAVAAVRAESDGWTREEDNHERDRIELPTEEDVWLVLTATEDPGRDPITFRLARPYWLSQLFPGEFVIRADCVTRALNFHPQIELSVFFGLEDWSIKTSGNFGMFRPLMAELS